MHVKAILQRFPYFTKLFLFHEGHIVCVNKSFKWNEWDSNVLCNYIITASYMEKPLISKYTDFDDFVNKIRTAPRLELPP